MIQQSTIDEYNRKKLVRLIREVSTLHGGEPKFDAVTGEILGEAFLSDYIAEVVKEWSNDLPTAIACFEDLKAQALALQKPVMVVKPQPERLTGHGAFREHKKV